MSNTRFFSRCILAISVSAIGVQARADLLGSQVTVNVALSTVNNPTSNFATATVGPGVEFPTGSLYTVGGSGSYFVIPVSIDLTANQIVFSYSGFVTSAPGAFNGYIFNFTGLPDPILNAYLDHSSSFTASQAIVGFSANQVTVNVPSQNFTPSTVNIVDLDFAPSTPTTTATPEPSSLALLGTGVLGVIGAARRRFA